MNFNELFQKMRELDQPIDEGSMKDQMHNDAERMSREKFVDKYGDEYGEFWDNIMGDLDEDLVDECGMGPMSSPQDQQDNVNMSVNMSGSGSGGIRDLLDILRNIEHTDGDDAGGDLGDLIGKMSDGPDRKMAMIGNNAPVDEYANEPDEMYAPVSAVTPTGNDMHSKGGEAPKVNGGGNPMGVDEEALLARLASLYESIKNR